MILFNWSNIILVHWSNILLHWSNIILLHCSNIILLNWSNIIGRCIKSRTVSFRVAELFSAFGSVTQEKCNQVYNFARPMLQNNDAR